MPGALGAVSVCLQPHCCCVAVLVWYGAPAAQPVWGGWGHLEGNKRVKLFDKTWKKLVAAGAVAAVGVVGITVAANAAGGTGCRTLTYPLCSRSVAATQVVDNSMGENEFTPAVRAKLNRPDKGAVTAYKFAPKTLTKIGGSFKTNKTKLGEFTLPAGSFKLDLSYFAARTVAGVPGTRPELALRVGASDTAFGDDYGTILGNEISPSKDREQTGYNFAYVTTTAPTTVEVFGFGYNDDAGSAGSGEIDMGAQVAVTTN